MAEAKRVPWLRTNEVLANEVGDQRLDFVADVVRDERCDCASMEDLPFDRRATDDLPLAIGESIEARLEKCLNRRRSTPTSPRSRTHCSHLLDEERVAARGGRDSGAHRRVRIIGEKLRDQRVALRDIERLEQERGRIELAAAPARP